MASQRRPSLHWATYPNYALTDGLSLALNPRRMSSASGPARTREPPRGGTERVEDVAAKGVHPLISLQENRMWGQHSWQLPAAASLSPGGARSIHMEVTFPGLLPATVRVWQRHYSQDIPAQHSNPPTNPPELRAAQQAARSSFLPLCFYRCQICIVLCATRLSPPDPTPASSPSTDTLS